MDQLNMSFMDNDTSVIANRYYNEILSLLEASNLGYDLSQIQVEHRDPESSDAYDTILMFKRPCFHIKGKKTKHIYLHPSFARLLEKAGYPFEPATVPVGQESPRILLPVFLRFQKWLRNSMRIVSVIPIHLAAVEAI